MSTNRHVDQHLSIEQLAAVTGGTKWASERDSYDPLPPVATIPVPSSFDRQPHQAY